MIDEKILNLSKQTKELINEAFDNNALDVTERFKIITSSFFNFLKSATSVPSQTNLPDAEFSLQFSSNIARIQFLISKYNLPDNFVYLVPSINKFKKKYQGKINQEVLDNFKNTIIDFLTLFIEPDKKINFKNIIPDSNQKTTNLYYKFQSFEIFNQGNFKYLLVCLDENLQTTRILLNEQYVYLKSIPKIDTILLITNLELDNPERNQYKQTKSTRIVVEPGFLFDITDIAECFSLNSINPLLYFKRILSNQLPNQNLAKGNLVNSVFDSLIKDPVIDFETAFKISIKNRPISLIASLLGSLNQNNNNGKKLTEHAVELKRKVYENYLNLQQIIPSLELGNYMIEPSFISETNGLQGRLDLLINKQGDEKNVVELKSGGFPRNNLKINYINSDPFINVWANHYAQANGYNLLLDDVFEQRRGTSAILYSSDTEKPLRNVPNTQSIKEKILEVRNRIMILYKQIITNEIDLEWIIQKVMQIQKFGNQNKDDSEIFDNLEIGEWEYLNECFRFIINEEYSYKLRNNLVRNDLVFNENRLSIQSESFQKTSNLQIDFQNSDFDQNHIILKTEQQEIQFRDGDQIIVYPDEFINQPTKFYILRGAIRQISNGSVKISLISKSTDRSLFFQYPKWTIELDNSDELTKKQLQTLTKFIFSSKENRKKVIYGYNNRFEHTRIPKYNYLNKKQQKLVQRAINNKDYFLIQGPPGTGKTSRILRALVEHYYHNTNSNILLMAFTNRSVEEICATLDRIEPNFPFLRISSKNIENYIDRSIPFLAEKLSINELLQLFNKTRVYVGTVAAFSSNIEIFQILNFDILILDEASQVLETQVNGFLTLVNKFILIGDINQLPAIAIQSNITQSNLNNFSIFDRLLSKSKENNTNPPIGYLCHQGRMHKKIQDLANYLTYQDNLYTLTKSQIIDNLPDKLSKFDHKWLSDRIVFVETPADMDNKSNKYEVDLISKFLIDYFEHFGYDIPETRIGIIAPFKKQCALIRDSLPTEIAQKITIDTVERFQGSERDIIIYSFAINQKFMLDRISSIIQINDKVIDRKFNVATTRARENLILLGNTNTLFHSPYYQNAIHWISQNATIIKKRGRKATLK